jgi:capsular polysaccharide transport system permease protein
VSNGLNTNDYLVRELRTEKKLGKNDPDDWLRKAIGFVKQKPWFAVTVVMPTLLATLYYGVIASDLYVAETHFVIRSAAQPQGAASLGTFLQSVGISRSTDDTFSVHDFIMSRNIVSDLAAKQSLKTILTRPEGDFIHRYPPAWGRNTFEQLFRSYKNLITVEYDTSTGISTLEVRAFRPEDAHNLAQGILSRSEDLINRMNNRARADAIAAAQFDVNRAENRLARAQEAITKYRLFTRDLDPKATAITSYTLLGQLLLQQANSKAQLAQIKSMSPNSPQIPSLNNTVNAIKTQIDKVNGDLTASKYSTTEHLSNYEKLLLEQEFGTKALASASISLETARQTANRQQLYLEEIVSPQVADYPIYPRRIINTLLVLMFSLLIYGIGWLISASVREHSGQ